ncbi:MAG: hypothetical protein ACP5JH_12025, partial [Bacteroidota bacterium]
MIAKPWRSLRVPSDSFQGRSAFGGLHHASFQGEVRLRRIRLWRTSPAFGGFAMTVSTRCHCE